MNAKAHKEVRRQKLLTDHTARLIGGQPANQDPPPSKFPYIDEINHRAETMTPLLKEILEFRSRPHWH